MCKAITLMWLCNSPCRQACEAFNIPKSPKEGWLISVADKIYMDGNIKFIYIFQQTNDKGISEKIKDGNVFISVPEECEKENFILLLKKYEPNVVHIWGTEYIKAHNMVMAAKDLDIEDKVVVSIQGVVGAYYYHYMANIPGKIQFIPSLRDIIRNDSLRKQQKNFKMRGEYEKRALKTVHHVIGRTFWDRAYCELINPNIHYHFNNETLRSSFYSEKWDASQCTAKRIFVSQASYPLKGFHFLLEAISLLSERHSDITVVVAGADNNFKPYYLDTAYGRYLRKLIRKYNLNDKIKYIGMLNEEQMLHEYLDAEVFVSPSAIENSPNSVCEAMLLGMPVISSNVGGVSELMIHEKEGYIYQADAPYMLAYYIDKFLTNKQLEIEFGRNARKHAQVTHCLEKNYSELIDIYDEIISR